MRKVVKLFGISEAEILSKLAFVQNLDELEMQIFDNQIDVLATFVVSEKNRIVFAHVLQILSEFIFSDENESLFERLDVLLNVRNRSVSICELGTAGKVVAGMCDFENSSHHVDQGIVLTSISAISKKFGIKFDYAGKMFSTETAQRLCKEFAFKSESDINVVVLLNLNLNPKTVLEIEPFGMTFVAISGPDGISVFKHLFTGNREKVMAQATAATCFHLIKELF